MWEEIRLCSDFDSPFSKPRLELLAGSFRSKASSSSPVSSADCARCRRSLNSAWMRSSIALSEKAPNAGVLSGEDSLLEVLRCLLCLESLI